MKTVFSLANMFALSTFLIALVPVEGKTPEPCKTQDGLTCQSKWTPGFPRGLESILGGQSGPCFNANGESVRVAMFQLLICSKDILCYIN